MRLWRDEERVFHLCWLRYTTTYSDMSVTGVKQTEKITQHKEKGKLRPMYITQQKQCPCYMKLCKYMRYTNAYVAFFELWILVTSQCEQFTYQDAGNGEPIPILVSILYFKVTNHLLQYAPVELLALKSTNNNNIEGGENTLDNSCYRLYFFDTACNVL
jgi:hypothetical protein